MSDLVIQLSGEIKQSNFKEWKGDLIKQIKAVNTELSTDQHFVDAADNVKRFKGAESALKDAKASAIKQAADINELFEAIDAIAKETRDVRLSLERQIKTRKKEIKKELIDAGIKQVRALIEKESADFQLIDHSRFLDRDIFDAAVSRKASASGIAKAVDGACAKIADLIASQATDIKNNASTLDSLASGYQVLFQDRPALLAMSAKDLNNVIDKRVSTYKTEIELNGAGAQALAGAADSNPTMVPDKPLAAESDDDKSEQGRSKFRLNIDIHGARKTASSLLDAITAAYEDHPAVTGIELVGVID